MLLRKDLIPKEGFTDNTKMMLSPPGQHFWGRQPLTALDRVPPLSTAQDQLRAPEACGPYGSDSPQNFSMKLGQGETIKKVIVRHGFIVDAIGFVVADNNGSTTTKIFGGNSGDVTKIPLKSDEYITHISGTYGKYAYSHSSAVVATLSIHTNLKPEGYGPYGRGQDVQNPLKFSSAVGPYRVVGFFGRHTNYLESVGVHFTTSVFLEAYGPYGSDSPQNYSMMLGQDEIIKEVIVRHGFIVDAIGFTVTDRTGNIISKIFGGNRGDETKIRLGRGEYITHISGTYGKYAHSDSSAVIATLSVHTNLKPGGYGPYGRGQLVQNPLKFSSAADSSPVVGFFGRHSNYLESVGVYHITPPY